MHRHRDNPPMVWHNTERSLKLFWMRKTGTFEIRYIELEFKPVSVYGIFSAVFHRWSTNISYFQISPATWTLLEQLMLLGCRGGAVQSTPPPLPNQRVPGLNGIYPSKLKLAKVIPLHKNNDESDPSNYRPISLLSIFNRIFEKMMYSRLKSYLERYNILDNSQYGFREKRSTEHAILDIFTQIKTNMDKKLYTCGIFIDLQKAFDTVNHSILLQKLSHCAIRGIINDWFTSYLIGRKQITEIGPRNKSSKEILLSGVPQGSVLGPLLFLIYVNDICNSCNQLKFYLFADDTNLLYADKNLKSLESTVNNELSKVYAWLIANKLSLNIKKSNFVIFRPRQKKLPYQVHLKVIDHLSNSYVSLECKSYVKYLGVLVDENLSWKHHIFHINKHVNWCYC